MHLIQNILYEEQKFCDFHGKLLIHYVFGEFPAWQCNLVQIIVHTIKIPPTNATGSTKNKSKLLSNE